MGQRLPPLNAVRVFEAAARRLSFARAAEELGVTQSAVSKQIALLESYIGAQLFERSATGVALTLEGRELRHSISPAFQALSESFLRFSRRTPRAKNFRLSTLASFAAQFMVPRLDDFETALPDVALEILTSDRLLDLTREEIDLSIRYGQGNWEGLIAKPLDQGVLVPVSSPTLFADSGGDVGRLLASAPRVQIFLKNEWRSWQEAGRPTPGETGPPLMLEHFLVALQAVQIGRGVALVPELLVRDLLATGTVTQFDEPVPWEHRFYAVHLPNAERRPVLRDALAWFLDAV